MANARGNSTRDADCRCVYVDQRLSQDLNGLQVEGTDSAGFRTAASHAGNPGYDLTSKIDKQIEELKHNITALLDEFEQIHLCTTGNQCLLEINGLDEQLDQKPILVIAHTPVYPNVPKSPHEISQSYASDPLNQLYGVRLLQRLASLQSKQIIIPIAMTRMPSDQKQKGHGFANVKPPKRLPQYDHLNLNYHNIKTAYLQDPSGIKCVCESGAIDVLRSPLAREEIRYSKSDGKHISFLSRECGNVPLAQIKLNRGSLLGYESPDLETLQRSQLLERLLHTVQNSQQLAVGISESVSTSLNPHKRQNYLRAISSWRFPAHEYEAEDLEHIACLMLEHCLSIPILEKYRLSRHQLGAFVRACRLSYNDSVQYHNFRHVIDVMQAIFFFLLQLDIIPPLSSSSVTSSGGPPESKSPIKAILGPRDALTLLVAAIGHDVGHPGLNNGFLTKIKSPLAQLYSDNSVLENFHSAAHTQILRRYWTSVYEDADSRTTLHKSILATDMFLHNKYIDDMDEMRRWFEQCPNWDTLTADGHRQFRVLTCSLLLKCADISNVARPYDIALKWGEILQLEFAAQGKVADRLGVDSCLFGGVPEIGNQAKLARSQTGFMNVFAKGLFAGIARIFPAMSFSIEEMEKNTSIFDKIATDAERKSESEGGISPKTRTPERRGSNTKGLASPDLTTSDSPEPGSAFYGTKTGASNVDLPRRTSADSRRSSQQGLSPRSGNTPPKQQSSSRRSSSNAYPLSPGEPRRSSATSAHRQPASGLSKQQSENAHPPKHGSESESTISPSSFAPTSSIEQSRSDRSSSGGGGGTGGGGGGGVGGFGTDGASDDRSNSTVSSSYRSLRSNNNSNGSSNRGFSSSQLMHHRDSSENHTSIATQGSPCSPATTQATSFITVDSDEKASHTNGYHPTNNHNTEWSPGGYRKESIPRTVDVEQPGSGVGPGRGTVNHTPKGSSSSMMASSGSGSGTPTPTSKGYRSLKATNLVGSRDAMGVGGGGGVNANGEREYHPHQQQGIQRKSSRFRIHHLWKRARKSGVDGTP